MRSPNYPAVGLGEAVNLAQAVWGREKRSYAPDSVIVQAWGYAGMSGNARTKLAALRKYGLFEDGGNGDLRLSSLAINILHHPTDSPERLAALREAAMAPELFNELQATYGDSSDESIRSYLMTRKGFSDTGADAAVKAFRDTQETARLRDMATTPEVPKPPIIPAPVGLKPTAFWGGPEPVSKSIGDDITTFRWPLSKGVSAEVRFLGPVKPAHLELLKRYLDVAKDSIEVETQKDKEEEAAE
jgi:hypothetical protein